MIWKTLREHRHFSWLFIACLISEVGSKIHRIALLVLVYMMTEEALWVSLALAVQLVTTVALGPLISAWADVQDRRRLLVASDLLRVPIVLLIPLIGVHSLGVLLVLIFLIEVLRNLHDPVANAVVPDLVPESVVDSANGLILFAQRFAEVAFVGLAGLLVGVVGTIPAFIIDAFTYLLSGVILLKLPSLQTGNSAQVDYWVRVKEGVGHLFGNPTIRRTVLTLFVAAMFGSVEAVLGIVLAVSFLNVGSAGFGVMEAFMALGAVLGTLLVPQLTSRIGREKLFLLGLLMFGLFEASVGVFPVFAWALIAYLFSGVLNMVFIVPARSILQLNTPPELRTRTFAAFGAVMNSAVLFGTVVGGAIEKPLGTPLVFILAGLLVALVAIVVLLRGGIQETGAEVTRRLAPTQSTV
jgi:MFS family permease